MFKILIIAEQNEQIGKLLSGLIQKGFICSTIPDGETAIEQAMEQTPNLVLIAAGSSPAGSKIQHLPQKIKWELGLPVLLLVSRQALSSFDSGQYIDDFAVEPWDITEVALRVKQVLWRTNNIDNKELIKCGDLTIDLNKCEVSLSGRLVPLTFKEYELLRFLSSNKGRVFSRETLLDKVWGYDYYGGDRTVDVHIRRLRSKIEDPTHTFIETVRNIGYKLRKDT